MKEGEELLTTKEVLSLLRISRASLYNMMKEGKIAPIERTPVLKQPRLQFRRSDVDHLLNKGQAD